MKLQLANEVERLLVWYHVVVGKKQVTLALWARRKRSHQWAAPPGWTRIFDPGLELLEVMVAP